MPNPSWRTELVLDAFSELPDTWPPYLADTKPCILRSAMYRNEEHQAINLPGTFSEFIFCPVMEDLHRSFISHT